MTRDDIIRMAKEAHKDLVTVDYPGHAGQLDPWTLRLLERFAALFAAAEREACAKVCEKLPETFKIAADEFGYEAEIPTAENYAAAIRTRDDT